MGGERENAPGKLSPEALSRSVFGALGAPRPEVMTGPAVGEDAAVIKWTGGSFLVYASDPIVGASRGAGKLLVRVNVNDIASKGGEPAYIVVTIIAPPSLGEPYVSSVMREIHEECRANGIAIVGGHTEFNDLYAHPVLSAALIGKAERLFRASDIRPGDVLFVTGHIGIEGMAILASDRPDLLDGVLSADEMKCVLGWMNETCVLEESRLLREYAAFMHDPTEGGFWGGVSEISRLANLSADIDPGAVPVHEYTRRASGALGFNPLSLVASGCLLAVVREENAVSAERAFINSTIPLTRVGVFTGRPYAPIEGAPPEELWGLLKRPRR
jgi:hydrogenase maturation factor